jgi:hypothetical protein
MPVASLVRRRSYAQLHLLGTSALEVRLLLHMAAHVNHEHSTTLSSCSSDSFRSFWSFCRLLCLILLRRLLRSLIGLYAQWNRNLQPTEHIGCQHQVDIFALQALQTFGTCTFGLWDISIENLHTILEFICSSNAVIIDASLTWRLHRLATLGRHIDHLSLQSILRGEWPFFLLLEGNGRVLLL